MTFLTELQKKAPFLNGVKMTESEAENLVRNLPQRLSPSWLIDAMQNYPLSGVCFSLDENDDESGMGVELVWFTAEQMIEEALSAYPGKTVLELGYLPIAGCLVGSGDPYFLKMAGGNSSDPALVRVPHDLVQDDDVYPEDKIEVVSDSLSKFLCLSQVD